MNLSIRDPVDIFVSAWDYYKLGTKYYDNMTLGNNPIISDPPAWFSFTLDNLSKFKRNQKPTHSSEPRP